MKRYLAVLLSTTLLFACSKDPGKTDIEKDPADFKFDVTFLEDSTDFANPERGFYVGTGLTYNGGSKPSPPSVATIRGWRTSHNVTLPLTQFYLNDFIDTPVLPDYVINGMKQLFENYRTGGCKGIVRFAYNWSDDGVKGMQDPPVEVAEAHIAQLKPLFEEYEDVIFCLQCGFVGRYGEWAGGVYTTNYEGETGKLNRKRVVRALLDAVPPTRQIGMRTYSSKQTVLDLGPQDTILTSQAFSSDDIARLGSHNDCFLYSGNDAGTYSGRYDRKVWKRDTRYTIHGGETCGSEYNETYCNCPNAIKEMENYHFTYLNYTASATQPPVVWKRDGCYLAVCSRLGYRLRLNGAAFNGDFKAGEKFNIKLSISNLGFASLMNQRKVEFIVMNANDDNEKYVFESDTDPRWWQASGTYLEEMNLPLPASLKSGERYNVFINLPDIAPTLHDNPDFSVRFANKKTWNPLYGYNLITSLVAK